MKSIIRIWWFLFVYGKKNNMLHSSMIWSFKLACTKLGSDFFVFPNSQQSTEGGCASSPTSILIAWLWLTFFPYTQQKPSIHFSGWKFTRNCHCKVELHFVSFLESLCYPTHSLCLELKIIWKIKILLAFISSFNSFMLLCVKKALGCFVSSAWVGLPGQTTHPMRPSSRGFLPHIALLNTHSASGEL